MAPRATWKGVLKISVVTIPIRVYPATESSEALTFHQLHDTCQTRMTTKKWCPTCACDVPSTEIVKGFEFEKGRYVLLLEAELDAVTPDSTRVIDLTQFADAEDLDPAAIARSYYLAPQAGPLAGEAFAVMGAAMTGKVGIGKLAIYGREYLVAVRVQPDSQALMLHTLHHAAERRPIVMPEDVDVPTGGRVPLDQVRLARQVILQLEGPLDLTDFTDAYRDDLRRLIDAKIAGQEIVEPAPVDAPPVLNLREALTQSLLAVSAAKKRAAKVTAPVAAAKRQPA